MVVTALGLWLSLATAGRPGFRREEGAMNASSAQHAVVGPQNTWRMGRKKNYQINRMEGERGEEMKVMSTVVNGREQVCAPRPSLPLLSYTYK